MKQINSTSPNPRHTSPPVTFNIIKNNRDLFFNLHEVSIIDLCKCKQCKDFGRGFYVTSSYEQAQGFVPLSVNKQIKEGNLPACYSHGYVSVFRFHLTPDIAITTLFPNRLEYQFCFCNEKATKTEKVLAKNNRVHMDPRTSALYLFCGKRCDRLKALLWEGDGFLLLYKRLETQAPAFTPHLDNRT